VEYTAIEIGGKSVGASLTSGQSALIYTFRGKRDSSNQGVRSTYIWDCKLGLNFVPAWLSETKIIVGVEIEFFCRLNAREWFTPKKFRGWFFDIYIQGSKKVQL